jgi:hypothetical protein
MGNTANGSGVSLFYVEEVAGEIPATPAFKPIRYVSQGLTPNIQQIDTAEMNQLRQKSTSRGGTYSVSGDIAAEMSFGSFDELIEAAMQSTWAADVLVIGKVERSFAIVERHTDIGVDYVYRGCRVNTMAINVPLNAPVGLTFGVMGTEAEEYTVPVDATFAEPTDSEIMVTTNIALTEAGVELAYATEWSATLDNGMEPLFALGSRSAYNISNGIATVTGSMSAYLIDGVLWGKVLNEDLTTHKIELVEGVQKYTIELPRVRYTQGQKQVSGPGAIIPSYTLSAGYDGAAGTTMKITRTAA